MPPKQQPPSSPESLLWAHQLKREHGFLLDRMQKLEAAIDSVEKSSSAAANKVNADVENLSTQVQALSENTSVNPYIEQKQKEIMDYMEVIQIHIEQITDRVAQVEENIEKTAADRKQQAAILERVNEVESNLSSYHDKMKLLGRLSDSARSDQIKAQLEWMREQAQDQSGKFDMFEESMALLERGIENLQGSIKKLTADIENLRKQYAKPMLLSMPTSQERIAQAQRLAEAFPEDPTPTALLDAAAKVARTKATLGMTGSEVQKNIVAKEVAALETMLSESSTPGTTAPETAAPKTAAPETTAPEITATETTATETASPETAAPEATAPETTAPETAALEAAVAEITATGFATPEIREPMPKPATDRAAAARAARAAKRKNSSQSTKAKNAKKARAVRAEKVKEEESAQTAPEPATNNAATSRATRATKQKSASQAKQAADLHTVRSSRVRKTGVEKKVVAKPPLAIDSKTKKPIVRAGRGWIEVARTPSPGPEAALDELAKRGRSRPKREDQSAHDVAVDLAGTADEQPAVPPAPPRKEKVVRSIEKKEKPAAAPKRRAIVQEDDTQNIIVFGKGTKRKAVEQPDEQAPATKRRTIQQDNDELYQRMFGKK